MLFADVLKSRQEMTSEMLHINVQIALLNGHAYELRSLSLSSSVRALRMAAQRAFGQKHLRLITGEKRVLVNSEQTLEEAQIKDGECLTVLVLQPHLAATVGAFALWCHGDSTIVTWGSAEFGGDSSAVQDQLRGLQQIQATESAFAAILADGSVVTWGNQLYGGDCSAIQDQLGGVQQIQATKTAFAAILGDGSVRTMQATAGAFAAILADGSVVTWGNQLYGGDSSAVQDQLRGVQQIQATAGAFAAIQADGSVVTWGDHQFGGDSAAVQDQLRGVQQIQASNRAFAAILADGSVVSWGNDPCGGDSSAVQDQLRHVQRSCLAHCCSVSLLSWSPKLASSRLAFRLSNTGFAKSIHIYNAVLCGLAP